MYVHNLAHISIHALLAESDPSASRSSIPAFRFLSTLSLRRATGSNQSIISQTNISIHALLAESDVMHALIFAYSVLFLSTLSLRRATRYSLRHSTPSRHFYPRSPCGERPGPRTCSGRSKLFLSTLSLRRATNGQFNRAPKLGISIHALLAESDRRSSRYKKGYPNEFLSTLSLRRATAAMLFTFLSRQFLSTLSLRRATTPTGIMSASILNFYPRSPCGERRDIDLTDFNRAVFLSTLSLRRATAHAAERPV